jgi:hypothetical protein
MKYLLPLTFILLVFSTTSFGQKKVDAMINMVDNKLDSVSIKKGKSFVVMLPVHNRNGDDWKLATPSSKCAFTESMLGQAGMLPNQPEPKLMFFKAEEKGIDSIKFVYKNPRAAADAEPEVRMLKVTIQ